MRSDMLDEASRIGTAARITFTFVAMCVTWIRAPLIIAFLIRFFAIFRFYETANEIACEEQRVRTSVIIFRILKWEKEKKCYLEDFVLQPKRAKILNNWVQWKSY